MSREYVKLVEGKIVKIWGKKNEREQLFSGIFARCEKLKPQVRKLARIIHAGQTGDHMQNRRSTR